MKENLFHPLLSSEPLPRQLNNPFCYKPHALCLAAWNEVCKAIEANEFWHEEAQKGKMFGVLIVQNAQHEVGFVAAYSGQLNGTYPTTFFVPPIFNYLSPDGYFKRCEQEISALNKEIKQLETSNGFIWAQKAIHQWQEKTNEALQAHKEKMNKAKQQRDEKRAEGIEEAENERLLNESRYLKACLKRLKQHYDEGLKERQCALETYTCRLNELKAKRKRLSDALQQWLFQQFVLCNGRGEQKTVSAIFKDEEGKTPPAGTGECCAPKLLHYAFSHHYAPLAMAEFWYGASPKGKIRQHGQTYSACKDKCEPLLHHFLRGICYDTNPLEQPKEGNIDFLYEDETLAVIVKPSGLPSVKGLFKGVSVEHLLEKCYRHIASPMIVHRLDMDTSGIMVVAKTKQAHAFLQQQFENRSVKKRYVALLDGYLTEKEDSGRIDLPLCADLKDRPKQMVNEEFGKCAITLYKVLEQANNTTKIALYPQTGRTHQLRVHCAHPNGLGVPIKGDRLYGRGEGRLCLHAEAIEFVHPIHHKVMRFENKAPF